MAIPITVVDAFAVEPFRGNPAAVCVLEAPADEEWMRRIAAEMNLSETAFLAPKGADFGLRWFTPKAEVDLCGHATLASAHVLWERGIRDPKAAIAFHTRSGVLTAARVDGLIELDFPAKPPVPTEPPPGLLAALGCKPTFVGKSQFDYLVELESECGVRALEPDYERLRGVGARGVIVTARSSDPKYDFVSRFFAPAVGIPEDPVTGSAHTCLGPHWERRLKQKVFVAFQASPRGGVIHVRVDGDRVKLGGRAVTIWRGELVV